MTNSTRGIQVVLVEDNTADTELTIDALRESHITTNILWLKDGAEAIELLFREPAANIIQGIKLVLLDLRLPRVNGLDVLPRIRSEHSTRRLPVVMLTSSMEESDLVQAYDLGTNSYLVKPVDADSFTQVVKEMGQYWMLLNKAPGDLK